MCKDRNGSDLHAGHLGASRAPPRIWPVVELAAPFGHEQYSTHDQIVQLGWVGGPHRSSQVFTARRDCTRALGCKRFSVSPYARRPWSTALKIELRAFKRSLVILL